MARTLLQLVQQACGEIGIPQPSSLFGSQNDTENQLIAISNREGKDFATAANKNGGWQALRKNYTFNLVPSQYSYQMPEDFEYFVQETFWDNKYKWALLGPINAQEQQILKYGVVASGPRNKFYVQNNLMYFDPIPQSTDLIAYQYYSKYWCQDENGIPKERWTADTDTYLLDEDCFVQGIKWRYLRMKGMDYGEEFNSYEMDKQRVIARDGGSRDLPLNGPGYGVQFLSDDNLPWTGYGGV